MAIIQNFKGTTIYKPGSYTDESVLLSGNLPLSEAGLIGLIGEAAKGAPGSSIGIEEWDSSSLADLVEYYGSGQIVEGARAIVNASNDARIQSGASRFFVYKTNASTQASLVAEYSSNPWATYTSSNYGVDENLISVDLDEDTSHGFSVVFGQDWSTTPGSDLTMRINGGAVVTITAASCTSAANTVTQLNTKINTALGTSGILYASAATNRITIDLGITGTGAVRNGICTSIEFIASSEWADVGVTVGQQGVALVLGETTTGLTASEPTRTISVARQSTETTEDTDSTTGEIGGNYYFAIGCLAATTAVVTINSTTFATTVSGSGASNLSLTLSNFATLNDLAEYINSQTGYYCFVNEAVNGSLPPTVLDRVSSVGICASTASIAPGRIKADAYEFQNWFDLNCSLVTLTRNTTYGYVGFPEVNDKEFLSGGALGASTTSSFNAGFTAFESQEVDILIPLVSQDASDDLAEDEEYTDSSSTYDVESIHTLLRNHNKLMSNIQNRKERQGYAGYRGTFAQCKTQANTLATEFVSLCFQDVQVIDVTGELRYMQPHIFACLVAGLQAGSEVGTPATFKYIAANGIKHLKKQGATPSSSELFNYNRLGDVNQAIQNGLLVAEIPTSGGVRIVCQNSTYNKDANFVFNRPHVLYSVHYIAKNLRSQLEAIYVGEKAKTGTASSIETSIKAIMKQFLDADITVADDTNDGLGFKNLSVTLTGNTAKYTITITPVQGIDFILGDLRIDNIRQTA